MKVVVLAGGISTERDVSLKSGTMIYEALKERHNTLLLDSYLGYEGNLDGIFDSSRNLVSTGNTIGGVSPDLNIVRQMRKDGGKVFFGPGVLEICSGADIVFLALHGENGENGKLQAAFDLLDIKYTGTDYLSSALAMNKARTKELFTYHGVPTPKAHMMRTGDEIPKAEYPCVVKVCNGGSSVGVYLVNNEEEYKNAICEAGKFDGEILIEEYIKGREMTVCVFDGKALPVVEITPKVGFYDYKNKYQAGSTDEVCPAPISEEITAKIQSIAIKAYETLGISTYARFDFIMDSNENFYCLEGNTLPGMTPTSLIPQEAKAIGVEFPELCEWIIKSSLAKYE